MKNFEFYWRVLVKNIEWIKFSEAKAIFLITIYGVILTITYTNAKDLYTVLSKSNWLIALTIITVLLAMASMFFCFLALNPVLKNDDPTSIVYFGHIKEQFKSSDEYFKHTQNVLQDDDHEDIMLKNISNQVYQTSKITWNKFKQVSWGIRCFAGVLVMLILEIIIYFLTV